MRAERFGDAIREFEGAYAVHPDPNLILNIGQAHRMQGHVREALAAYERYLEAERNPDDRIRTEIDLYISQSRALLKAAEKVKKQLGEPKAGVQLIRLTTASQAVVVRGDLQRARTEAEQRGLQQAVRQVAQWLDAPPQGDDLYVDQNVYQKPNSFVLAFWQQGSKLDTNILALELGVDVNVVALREALKGHQRPGLNKPSLGRKRVLILATESIGPAQIFGWPDYLWGTGYYASPRTVPIRRITGIGGMEQMVVTMFSKAGFNVIDVNVLRGKLHPKPLFEVLNLSSSEARSIAQKADADLVVVVQGSAQLADAGLQLGGLRSGQANVVARVVSAQDGRVLSSTNQHAAQVHLDADTARMNALNEAARLAASQLVRNLEAGQ